MEIIVKLIYCGSIYLPSDSEYNVEYNNVKLHIWFGLKTNVPTLILISRELYGPH